jgi:hypothetical protein
MSENKREIERVTMKLAVIGPAFFGYLDRICAIFTQRGIPACYFDDRPRNTVVTKAWLRFVPSSIKAATTAEHSKRTADVILKGGFTHVLLVSPEVFPVAEAKRLASAGLTLCRYGWDSVANKPHMQTLDLLMARIASFDPEDCKIYGHVLIPLYSDIPGKSEGPRRRALMYCATLHSRRPQLVKKVLRICGAQNIETRFMLFYHSRWLWLVLYGWNPKLWPLFRMISAKPFSREEIQVGMESSTLVLDIHHHGQVGLTMRFFEALAAGAAVLTTNAQGLEGLPVRILERVVTFVPASFEAALERAVVLSLRPLSAEDHYFLSVERFIDQIHALLVNQPVPTSRQ